MADNFDNSRRAFAEVVAIDAWHDDFDGEIKKVDLHADVVFGTARIGGEVEAPVRFRLSVKRAEVVVIVPEVEPVSVDRASVSRDSPELEGRVSQAVEQNAQASAKGAFSVGAGQAGLAASVSADASVSGSISASKKLEVSAPVKLISVTQSMTEDGHYRWLLEPGTSSTLKGRPWNAATEPRLKLVDRRKDRTRSIPPTVRVEVRCRREDLVIEDVQIKDEGLWQGVKNRVGVNNRLAAAESYIRNCLAKEGLEVKNIEDVFGKVTLGSTTAQTQKP
jgi:hypothetical protein